MITPESKLDQYVEELPYYCIYFITDCYKKHLTEKTIEAYAYELLTFFHYLKTKEELKSIDEIDFPALNQLTTQDVKNYIYQAHKRKNGNGRALTALRKFFYYYNMEGKITSNPTLYVTPPSKIHREASTKLTHHQLLNILEDPISSDYIKGSQIEYVERTELRDQCILQLLVSYDLSLSEIRALDLQDIDWNQRKIILKRKTILLNDSILKLLEKYITEERAALVDNEYALFIGSRSKRERLSIRTYEKLVRKYTQQSSIELKKLHKNQYKEVI